MPNGREVFAVVRARQQIVHDLALAGGRVLQEREDLVGRRNAAGDVQPTPGGRTRRRRPAAEAGIFASASRASMAESIWAATEAGL